MPTEIFPSSYECDCGHRSDFFETTVWDAKAMSHTKKVYLADSASDEHTIVFYHGKMIAILCSNQQSTKPGKHE